MNEQFKMGERVFGWLRLLLYRSLWFRRQQSDGGVRPAFFRLGQHQFYAVQVVKAVSTQLAIYKGQCNELVLYT
jgi:hypothetical protein